MEALNTLKIGIASDHAGFELKATVKAYLESEGAEVMDFGTNSSESCDYPDFAHPLASAVEEGQMSVWRCHLRYSQRHLHDSEQTPWMQGCNMLVRRDCSACSSAQQRKYYLASRSFCDDGTGSQHGENLLYDRF